MAATTTTEPILLTERGVCDLLSLGRGSVRKLMAAGSLPYLHIGRSLRFHRADVLKLADGLRTEQQTPAEGR